MPVARWMGLCNSHYYATRDPFGAGGDFTTAPEISQMFGELIGAWLTDVWRRAGSPDRVRLVELGPGRGTLMADMLRSMAAARWAPAVDFVETSPVLRAAQGDRVANARWHDSLDAVPDDAPLLLVANEFFDALPVRQFVRSAIGWHERIVAVGDAGFAAALGNAAATPLIPELLWNAPVGSVVETSLASTAIAAEIGARLSLHGGAALFIDYGHSGPVTGDTLQAVRGHAPADPFADPGEADLTAHVDFTALAAAAGTAASGPTGQGDFLRAIGIDARAETLRRRATAVQREAIDAAVARLTGETAMGRLFKVMALTGRDWPAPAGFA
ncbi:class I SAM-dependent methyltransferase [Polymorphobacter sp. PAMC 29334]|uniref:class I SAM-dependent methyltransferase n=1 Tax=Polymorphobacter sp. PAMC 29334 TaxID=2862331 RepID=UPI001D02FBF3|nr:SAM-dependent methyltransferase [Polymorphobacter sp. PAMC 29334]